MSGEGTDSRTPGGPVSGWEPLDIQFGPVWLKGKDVFHENFIERLRQLPEDRKPIVGGYDRANGVMVIEEGEPKCIDYPPGVQRWELAVLGNLEPVGYKLKIEGDGDTRGWSWEQVEERLRPIADYFGDYVGIADNFQVELIGFPYKIGLIELTDNYRGPNETGRFRVAGDAMDPSVDNFFRGTRQYYFKDKTLLSYWGDHLMEGNFGYGNMSCIWVSSGASQYEFHLVKGYNLEVWAPIMARQLLQLGVDGDIPIRIEGLSGVDKVLYKDSLKLVAERFDCAKIGIASSSDTLEVGKVTFSSGAVYELDDGRKLGIVSVDPTERRVEYRYDTSDIGTNHRRSFEEFARLGIETDGQPITFWGERDNRSHRVYMYSQSEDYRLVEAVSGECDRLVGVVDREDMVSWTDKDIGHSQLMGEMSLFETDVRVEFQYSRQDNTWQISGNSDEILEFLNQLPKMVPRIKDMKCRYVLQPIDAKDSRLTFDGGRAMGCKWLKARMKQLWKIDEIDFDDGREYKSGKRYGLRPRRVDETADEYMEMVWRVKDLRIERGRLLPRQEYGESLEEYWQRLNQE